MRIYSSIFILYFAGDISKMSKKRNRARVGGVRRALYTGEMLVFEGFRTTDPGVGPEGFSLLSNSDPKWAYLWVYPPFAKA